MKNNRTYLVLIIFLILSGIDKIYAQESETADIIHPSPQAQSFTKFVDFPMDLSTGLPNISIPLYTIKSKELTLPISIRYHSSGLRPNQDVSGTVGLGWSINAGGMISRTIKRKKDETVSINTVPRESDLSGTTIIAEDDPDAALVKRIARNEYETAHDIFSYIIPGNSGKFIFERNGVLEDFLKPVLMPYEPINISPHLTEDEVFDYFEVTDETGIYYRFGKSVINEEEFVEKYQAMDYLSPKGGISTWLLTEIISTDKSDTISFEYDDVLCNVLSSGNWNNYMYAGTRNFTKTFTENENSYSISYSQTPSGYIYTQKKLKTINFKHGRVEFDYSNSTYPDHQLRQIEVYSDYQVAPIKTIKFTQSEYHSISNRLNWRKLDAISFQDNIEKNIYNYEFSYKEGSFPVINTTLESNTFALPQTYSIDFWGYYNGASNIDGTLPGGGDAYEFEYMPPTRGVLKNIFGDADRDPDPDFSKVGVLETIIYPTGALETYTYEGNTNVGGLRIKSIKKTDGSEELIKTFVYGNSNRLEPLTNCFLSNNVAYVKDALTGINDIYTASSQSNVDLTIHGKPVIYEKVTEYLGDENTNSGYIEHYFDATHIKPFFLTENYFNVIRGYPWLSNYCDAPLQKYYRDLVFGDFYETKTNIYDATNRLVRSSENIYANDIIQRFYDFEAREIINITAPIAYGEKLYFFAFYESAIEQLKQSLTKTINIDYFYDSQGNQSSATDTVSYNYNNYNLLKIKTTTNSDGKSVATKYKYSTDYNLPTSFELEDDIEIKGLIAMADNNMISIPIETVNLVDNKVVSGIINTYVVDGSKHVVPHTTLVLETDNAQTEDNVNNRENSQAFNYSYIYFDSYGEYKFVEDNLYPDDTDPNFTYSYDSNGNITQVAKKDDITTSYFWGYNNTSPIIEVKNISYANLETAVDIALSEIPTRDYIGIVDLETFLGEIDKVDSPAEIELLEHFYDKLKSELDDVVSGIYSFKIYTYDPLIGTTSVTDENGIKTFYRYDGFGRLKEVLDSEGNIINSYEYNYAQ